MKYSLLMPFYNRVKEFKYTLDSFQRLYPDRVDYEVIVVEDLKTINDPAQHHELLQLLPAYEINIIHVLSDVDAYNPSRAFNLAAQKARGEYFILTNPECMHETNILAGLDEEFAKHREVYIICACKAVVEPKMDMLMWYQHSEYNSRMLHFCSALPKGKWEETGGFNEAYLQGCMYDDDDWLERVKVLGIPIIQRDDLIVLHIEHDRSYNHPELVEKNRILYNQLWGRAR